MRAEQKWTYAPHPRCVGLARAAVRGEVRSRGFHADTAELLTSELSTNAITHGRVRGRLFQVATVIDNGFLTLTVSDADRSAPPLTPAAPAVCEEHGRGLLLVAALSEEWGIQERPVVGKSVWCRIRLTRSGDELAAPTARDA